MKLDSKKNPAPIASEHKPDFANARSAAPEKGTLMKKKNVAAGGATGTTGARSHVKATGGAAYGITAKIPAYKSPEAGLVQGNGKIIPAATKRSRPNFQAGAAE